jgi:tellurium resistance protein TerD
MLDFFKKKTEATPTTNPAVASGINLVKGERISLTKQNPNLNEIFVGLGWDVNKGLGSDYDLDASAFLLGANGKIDKSRDFVYFGNLKSANGSVQHMGDNLTGAGEGDDEVVKVSLSNVSENVQRIVFTVSIYQAKSRRQNFGKVSNAFIRIVDKKTGSELVRYNLTDDYSKARSVIVGELYRHEGEWKFSAVGEGVEVEISDLENRFS